MAFCSKCTQGYVLPGEPQGTITADTHAYFSPARPASDPMRKKRAVIILTDVFGLTMPNPKLMADEFAQMLECDVYIPDVFNGAPIFRLEDLQEYERDVPGIPWTLWERICWLWAFCKGLPRVFANRASVTDPRIQNFIRHIKKTNGYESVGAVGYCWGGAAAVRLASTDLIQAVVIAHPSIISKAEVAAIKTPSSWICAEEDSMFPVEFRLQCEALLASKKTDLSPPYEFHDYRDVVHGFAARPNMGIPAVQQGFRGSFDQTVAWFSKHL